MKLITEAKKADAIQNRLMGEVQITPIITSIFRRKDQYCNMCEISGLK